MVFHYISEDVKNRVLWLLDNDYIPEDVCDILGVSQSSLYQWKKNFELHKHVIPPYNPFQGQPRKLNANQTHDLFTMLDESPELFLDKIQDWIAVTELIRDTGVTYKLLRKSASERDEGARQEWRDFVSNNLLGQMVITADESSKDGQTIFQKRGRAPQGHRAEIDADFVRGD